MLRAYYLEDGQIRAVDPAGPELRLPARTLWLDLYEPSETEEDAVERALGIDVPTREEMKEIEASSRLYREDSALFMTATVVAHAESETPESTAVTFILAGDRLVTVRYADPLPFRAFATYALRHPSACGDGAAIFIGLLEAIVDRIADILEAAGADLDRLSREVFSRSAAQTSRDFQQLLSRLGRAGDLASKVRESLVSIGRLLAFAIQGAQSGGRKTGGSRLKTIGRDVASLSDHASFLSNKVSFLLDATLGMINIEQNAIIKIFSVAAVVFLPPTLIASIYGMNFEHMPELGWPLGYPLALALMVASAILPYWYFKRRRWL
ncbi:MAG TPA: magnesium transporter CorA family protein [Geminicoccaceae bacterium]|nr:magnesium transporter CorA family protein [Geminicoccaceae bacterium]